MCLAALKPLSLLSPALAIGSSLFRNRSGPLDRQRILYPNETQTFGSGYDPRTGGIS